MLKIKFIVATLVLAIVFIGCEDRTDLTAPSVANTGNADFSKFVSMGNSLTAGYQSSALYEDAQNYSFGKMIADQVGANYVQPTISNPGIGGRIEVQSVSPFSTFTQPEDAGQPTNLGYAGIYNNLGIPGALLPDLLQATDAASSLSKTNVFFDIILRGQGTTVLEQALALQPTIATLWIGNNDILGYATTGGTLPHTPEVIFAEVYNTLAGAIAQAGIPTVIANIPNVRDIPFFTTVGPGIGLAIQAAQASNSQIVGLVYQDSETIIGVATVEDLFTNSILITLKGSAVAAFIGDTTGAYYSLNGITVPPTVITQFPFGLTQENPFPTEFVLDKAEQNIVETVTAAFNSTIASAATTFGLHLVDVNSFFSTVAANGFVANGVHFTAEFVSGGLFSLDGVHPTSQGYAIIANEFIKVINADFNASIPEINVSTIPGSLELAKKVSYNKFGLPIFAPGTFDNFIF